MHALERVSVRGLGKQVTTAALAASHLGSSIWESCLRRGCSKGALWTDCSLPRQNAAPFHIRYKSSEFSETAEISVHALKGLSPSSEAPLLFSLLHLKNGEDGDLISDWSLYCAFLYEATAQVSTNVR